MFKRNFLFGLTFLITCCNNLQKNEFLGAGRSPSAAPSPSQVVDESLDQNEEIDSRASEPVAVAGAYLVDCSWLEEDASKQVGIGTCHPGQLAQDIPLSAFLVEKVLLVSTDESFAPALLETTDSDSARFEIPHRFYGKAVTMTLVIARNSVRETLAGIELKNLPQSAPPLLAKSEPTGQILPVATPTLFTLNTFKLGDDGPAGSTQCTGLQTLAANNKFYGARSVIAFDVLADQADVTFALSRICGNGSGGSGSVSLAHMDLYLASDSSLISTAMLPASSTANDVADGNWPTAAFTANKSLKKGSYILEIVSGKALNNLLDDMTVDRLKITGLSVRINGQQFK